MSDHLREILSRHLPFLPEELQDLLLRRATLRELNKKDLLLTPGDAEDSIFFIVSGLVRVFHLREDGTEKTLMFRWEGSFLGNYDAIVFHQPSRFSYEILEPTVVLSLSYQSLMGPLENLPQLAAAERMVMMKLLGELLNRNEDFILLTPEQRYLKQLTQNAAILNRVQDKHLASLLGVTPVSLSRLKSRLLKRN